MKLISRFWAARQIGILIAGIHCITLAGCPDFFVLDNGVGRGTWTPEKQARTLKELGYQGIGYNYTTPAELSTWLKAFNAEGLKIYSLYVHTFIDKATQYDPGLKQAIRMLEGTDTRIWITLRETAKPGDHDAQAVKLVQEVADLAAASGLKVALYGHAGFYVAHADDAVRVVRKVNRPNVGATLNLCHEFMTKRGDQLEATLTNAAPFLTLVTINGVDVKSGTHIMRLDQGDFDVGSWVAKLWAVGYRGPVGLQCYGVKGDVTENLKGNIASWRRLCAALK